MKKAAVIILNWNRTDQTISLIDNFLKVEVNLDLTFIIVDNNSSQEEKDKLLKHSENNGFTIFSEENLPEEALKLNNHKFAIFLNENYGYAKGNNFGLKLANNLDIEYSLISNNDIILESPSLQSLIEELEKEKDVAVIGPKIIGLMGETQGPYGKPTLASEFWIPFMLPFYFAYNKFINSNKQSNDDSPYPYRVMGCFMLVETKKMAEVGYFDEKTFLYAEELILSEKLLAKGYKTKYYPDVYIKHMHGFSTKDLGNKKKFLAKLQSDLYYFKNYRSYGPLKCGLIKMARNTSFHIWEPLLIKVSEARKKVRN